MRELVRLLAQVDAAYLSADPGLPCCPQCTGILRQESSTALDVAHCIAAGKANSISLAAWHLAEAWNAGDASADVLVSDDGVGGFRYTVEKRGEPLEIEQRYQLAGGSCGCTKNE
jgi:hypothetical protein